jgi:hypothetical protein
MKNKRKNILTRILGIFPLLSLSIMAKGATQSLDFFPEVAQILISVGAFTVVIAALIMIYKVVNLMVRRREVEIYKRHGLEEYLNEKHSY